jgi:uncharacterized membrane protein SirB2
MFTGFYHTHKLVVVLFVLLYLIKTFLLVAGKQNALGVFRKYTRIPEMIISTLFLLTGIYLLFNSANIGTLTIVKIALVFVSIPVALIAFKKSNKGLAVLSLLLILTVYGLAEINKKQQGKISIPDVYGNQAADKGPVPVSVDGGVVGKQIYEQACIACHGKNGDACLSGAKNLQISVLEREAQIKIIRNGKNTMPAYKNLTDAQVNEVINYINGFKKLASQTP